MDVTICQDCGVQNETVRAECRLCGAPLDGEPDGEPSAPPATGRLDDVLLDTWAETAGGGSPTTDRADEGASADRALPPLPDGGLATMMPDWLHAVPAAEATSPHDHAPVVSSLDAVAPGSTSPPADRLTGAGPPRIATDLPDVAQLRPSPEAIDPSSFLTEDDLPAWIRQLVANEAAGAEVTRGATAAPEVRQPAMERVDLPASSPTPLADEGTPPEEDAADRPGDDQRPAALATTAPALTAGARSTPAPSTPSRRRRHLLLIALGIGLILLAMLAYLLAAGGLG